MAITESSSVGTTSGRSADYDVVIIGAGVAGIYQLYQLREAGFGPAGRGRHRRRGNVVLEPLPGGPLRLRELLLRVLLLRGAARGVGLVGALRRPGRDRGVPELRRRPVRPARPHAVRAPASPRPPSTRPATWTLTTEDGAPPRARFVVVGHRRAVGAVLARHPRPRPLPGRGLPHGPVAQGAGRLRRQEGGGDRHRRQRRAAHPRGRQGGRDRSRVPAHAELERPAQQREDHRRGAGRDQGHLRRDRAPACAPPSPGSSTPTAPKRTFDDSKEERWALYEKLYDQRGFAKLISNYHDMLIDREANAEFSEFLAEKIRERVDDPATAEKLIPKDHGFGMRRPPMETGYYEAYNRPNVKLVDLQRDADRRITEAGIETSDGERAFDIIVWATGFDGFTGALTRMGARRHRRGSGSRSCGPTGPTPTSASPSPLPEPSFRRWPPLPVRQRPPGRRHPGRLRGRAGAARVRARLRPGRAPRRRPRSPGPRTCWRAPSRSWWRTPRGSAVRTSRARPTPSCSTSAVWSSTAASWTRWRPTATRGSRSRRAGSGSGSTVS